MKKSLYMLIIFLWSQLQIFGQTNPDTIQFKSIGLNYTYSLNGKNLNLNQLTAIIKTNPASVKYLNAAKLSDGISTVFLYSGSFLIGYGIGYSIAKHNLYLDLISLGSAILLVDIPITVATKENLRKSINIYNNTVKNQPTLSNNIKLNVGITQNGVGLILKF